MSDQIKELETLIGEHRAREVVVDGEKHTVVIRQIKTGQIPKLLRVMGPLISVLTDSSQPLNLNKIFLFYAEDCLGMLAVLVDKPREFIDQLEIDDAVLLISDALEVNLDFFVQRVLPLLTKGVQRMMKEMQEKKGKLQKSDGLKRLSTLLEQGTESQTSGSTSTESSSSTSEQSLPSNSNPSLTPLS